MTLLAAQVVSARRGSTLEHDSVVSIKSRAESVWVGRGWGLVTADFAVVLGLYELRCMTW